MNKNKNGLNRRNLLVGIGASTAIGCSGTLDWARKVPEHLPYLQKHIESIRSGTKRTLIRNEEIGMDLLCQNVNGLPWPVAKWGSRRPKHMAAANAVATHQPEFAWFQEVIFEKDAEDYYKSLGYHMTYQKGQHPFFNQGGLLTLSKKRPTETNFSKFISQGDMFSWQWTDAWLEKGVQSLFFAKERVAVLNTHLAAGYGMDINRANIEQTEELVEYIKKLRERGWNALIAGDFNHREGSKQYSLLNTVTTDHTRNSGPTHKNGGRIDVVRSTFTDLPESETETVKTDSDHRMLVTNIRGITVSALASDKIKKM